MSTANETLVPKSLSERAKALAGNSQKLNVIEFATSRYGLNQKLFPAQRFLLKVFTKMPLDDTIRDIDVRDKFNKTVLFTCTEKEMYEYWYGEKRISMSYEEYLHSDTIQFNVAMGRRASKSTMIGILCAYLLYEILLLEDPQQYFGIVGNDPMDCTILALGETNAKKLFAKFTKMVRQSPFFQPFLLDDPSTMEMKIWTKKDLKKLANEGRANQPVPLSNSINIRAIANSPQVRGDNNLFVIMEEVAHYNQAAASSREKPLDEAIYEAVTPSISGFKTPEGKPFGRIFLISSPNGKKGKFWNEVESSYLLKGESGSLTLEAPTWEINPIVSPVLLQTAYAKNPASYDQEYGAKFIEGGLAWITEVGQLYRSINKDLAPGIMVGRVDRLYFCGVDFALSSDGTAITVCHYEPHVVRQLEELTQEAKAYNTEDFLKEFTSTVKGRYVVDYSEVRYAGKPPYENRKTLLIEDVLAWVDEVYQRFPIQAGMYDQWSGEIITQLLQAKGIKRLHKVNHTATVNDSQYKTFSELLHTDQLVLPNDPTLIKELLSLQCTDRGNGIISVEAPQGGSLHDDRFDSLIRALTLAFVYHTKNQGIAQLLNVGTLYQNRQQGGMAGFSVKARQRALRGGVQSIRDPSFNNNRITNMR